MRRSLCLLVLGVVIPGVLSAMIYHRIFERNDHATMTLHGHRVVVFGDGATRVRVRAVRPARAPRAPIPPVRPLTPRARAVVVATEAGDCRHSRNARLEVPATVGLRLDVDAGPGALRIEGVSGLERVEVEARACASSAELLEELHATLERSGERVLVETFQPDGGAGNGQDYARLDLTVRVPLGMPARVADDSGDASISGTGRLDLQDGSGGLQLGAIDGPVRVRDGSGETRLADVVGDLVIVDGSGSLEVINIDGSVTITDGSGSIRIANVNGDLTVGRDGSGTLRWSRVAGRVSVPREGG